METLQVVDLSRGRASLAMILSGLHRDHLMDHARTEYWFMRSGYGEALRAEDYRRLIDVDPRVLWPSWQCYECGARGEEPELRTCPGCGSDVEILPTRWTADVRRKKIEKGRLAYQATTQGI